MTGLIDLFVSTYILEHTIFPSTGTTVAPKIESTDPNRTKRTNISYAYSVTKKFIFKNDYGISNDRNHCFWKWFYLLQYYFFLKLKG